MIERFAERASAYLETDANRAQIRHYLGVYLSMMRLLHTQNVAESAEFHRLYNVFYKLRFSGSNGHTSGEIYEAYYRLIEAHKHDAEKPSIECVLDELWTLTGKVHLSFSSKLIATLYPESAPVWDNNVRALLQIPYETRPGNGRLALAAEAYHALEARYAAFLPENGTPAPEAAQLIAVFDGAFPEGRDIAAWKKTDFLLWRMGSRKTRGSI